MVVSTTLSVGGAAAALLVASMLSKSGKVGTLAPLLGLLRVPLIILIAVLGLVTIVPLVFVMFNFKAIMLLVGVYLVLKLLFK